MDTTTDSLQSAISTAEHTITDTTHQFVTWIRGYLTWNNLFKVVGVVLVLLIALIIYKLIMRAINKVPPEKMTTHRQVFIKNFVKYLFFFLIVMYVLGLFGIKLSAIWGAAGIAGVAIGFAAQTSVSNIISGIFVITEGVLKIGDTIIVDGVTGVIDSINLLSVRVHTLDNQMVRIPNSTIINSNLTNNSFHKIRRVTISVDVAYNTDLNFALETIKKVPALCPTVLQDPAPNAWYDGFGESGIKLTLAVWFNSTDLVATKNDVYVGIKKVFDASGINIPFPQVDVHFSNMDKDEKQAKS